MRKDVYKRQALMGVACALAARLFCSGLRFARYAYGRLLPNPYFRILTGGGLLILLTLLAGSQAYNGAGTDVVIRAFAGEARPEAFLLKILFTSVTLGAGYKLSLIHILETGIHTLFVAGAIAMGIVLVSSMTRILAAYGRRRREKQESSESA